MEYYVLDVPTKQERKYQEQASAEEQWKIDRWGKLTGSKMGCLMVQGKGQTFGAGAMTYINDVAREAYTNYNDEDSVETWAMKQGKIREPEAFAALKRRLGHPPGLEYYGTTNPYFEPYCPDSGVSPDCILWKDKPNKIVTLGAELKSPTSKTHWTYLDIMGDQWDLKRYEPDYYAQVQFQMIVFKADLWLWTSYNVNYPFADQLIIVEVQPDIPYQNDMKLRLKLAIAERNRIIAMKRSRNAA